MKKLRQLFVYMIIFSVSSSLMAAPARAAMIGTDQLSRAESREQTEQRLALALSRPELARALEKFGVAPEDARRRVAALTDEELARLSGRVDKLPAGGDFFGTIGAIFIILVITDLLGFTKVFPFTRAQR